MLEYLATIKQTKYNSLTNGAVFIWKHWETSSQITEAVWSISMVTEPHYNAHIR